MSCIFSCIAQKKNVKSAQIKVGSSTVTADEMRAHKEECRKNKKAFIEKYPNSRQARELHKGPRKTAHQIQEDILRASGPSETSAKPTVTEEKEHRRVTSHEAALARARERALQSTSMTAFKASSESTCFIPIGKFESQQLLIRSKGQMKLREAAIRASQKQEQSNVPITKSTRPEKVIPDVGMIKSRPSSEGCLETRIGQKVVQSTVPLTPATIRTIALYPDAWEATKGAIDREGSPIKKITRKSSNFEKEPRSPLPPKAKSATSH